jgi:hypothetical protein
MFIKVIKDGSASFDARKDGPRFMRAALEFKDDPSDLLYCLTKPQVHSWHSMPVAPLRSPSVALRHARPAATLLLI